MRLIVIVSDVEAPPPYRLNCGNFGDNNFDLIQNTSKTYAILFSLRLSLLQIEISKYLIECILIKYRTKMMNITYCFPYATVRLTVFVSDILTPLRLTVTLSSNYHQKLAFMCL